MLSASLNKTFLSLSTHFIYSYMASDMVKDHSYSERKPASVTTWATLSGEGFLYMYNPTDIISYTTAFVTPIEEH